MIDPDENRKRDEKKFWSAQAEKYDRWIKNAFDDQYEIFRKRFRRYIKNSDRVLEIATGTGDIAFNIADRCEKVVGTDISEEMIVIAKTKNEKRKKKNVSFRVEDGYNLSFQDGSFDKVICCNALQTMKEPEIAIKEGKRVLKSNGEFLSITYCYGDSSFIDLFKLTKFAIKRGRPKYWTNFKRKQLKKLFEDQGFKIIESEDVWDKPVVLFLRCRKR